MGIATWYSVNGALLTILPSFESRDGFGVSRKLRQHLTWDLKTLTQSIDGGSWCLTAERVMFVSVLFLLIKETELIHSKAYLMKKIIASYLYLRCYCQAQMTDISFYTLIIYFPKDIGLKNPRFRPRPKTLSRCLVGKSNSSVSLNFEKLLNVAEKTALLNNWY